MKEYGLKLTICILATILFWVGVAVLTAQPQQQTKAIIASASGFILQESGHPVVSISVDGTVTIMNGGTSDAASKSFYDQVSRLMRQRGCKGN